MDRGANLAEMRMRLVDIQRRLDNCKLAGTVKDASRVSKKSETQRDAMHKKPDGKKDASMRDKEDGKTMDKEERVCSDDVKPLPFVMVSLDSDDDDGWEKVDGEEDEWEVI
jgi:hypothetical protein